MPVSSRVAEARFPDDGVRLAQQQVAKALKGEGATPHNGGPNKAAETKEKSATGKALHVGL